MTESMNNAPPAVLSSKNKRLQMDQESGNHPLQGLTIETMHGRTGSCEDSASTDSSLNHCGDFEDYNIDTAILAWDQIGDLSHEITSSLMAKQASVLCERFRKFEAQRVASQPPAKRRCVEVVAADAAKQAMGESSPHSSLHAVVVTSDEETSHTASTDGLEDCLPDDLDAQVDRIGRMSKLVMEIEYCQRELRKEMVAMSDDQL